MKVCLAHSFLRSPIAHRGLHCENINCPENSLWSAQRAIGAGYGIEIDLQLSGDDRAIVFHDNTLDRMTLQTGDVDGYNAAELENITLKGSTENIPTLESFLQIVNGRVPLLIEIKGKTRENVKTDGKLEWATARTLLDYAGFVAVMSFNPHAIAHMEQFAPQIPRGLTTEAIGGAGKNFSASELKSFYKQANASFLCHNVSDINSHIVNNVKTKHDPLLCWTVRSKKQEILARKVADNIIFENYWPNLP